MNVFETIGMIWVIFTSALSTVTIGYLTVIGLRTVLHVSELRKVTVKDVDIKEAFKIPAEGVSAR
jgi:hypothetical protein